MPVIWGVTGLCLIGFLYIYILYLLLYFFNYFLSCFLLSCFLLVLLACSLTHLLTHLYDGPGVTTQTHITEEGVCVL